MKRYFPVIIFLTLFAAILAQTATTDKTPLASPPSSQKIDAARLLEDVKTLSADEMEGRGVGTPGGAKARAFVVKRFAESKIKPFNDSYVQPFDFTNRAGTRISGANVVGFVEGNEHKDKYIVVTAHYDHVGIQRGEIYNGADDDASGTAALFALAQYFSVNKPAHSLIFAAFDGEESGLRGSKFFVGNPPVAKESIRLNINLDMIARSDANELYASGTYHYPQFKPTLETIAKTANLKLLFGHDRPEQGADDWTSQSDHFAFHQGKIPFVYFGVENHQDYHKPTDDFVNIQPEFYVHAVETILEAVKGFDKPAF